MGIGEGSSVNLNVELYHQSTGLEIFEKRKSRRAGFGKPISGLALPDSCLSRLESVGCPHQAPAIGCRGSFPH